MGIGRVPAKPSSSLELNGVTIAPTKRTTSKKKRMKLSHQRSQTVTEPQKV